MSSRLDFAIRSVPGNLRAVERAAELLQLPESVVWAGAGVSAPHFPLWDAFLRELTQEAVAAGLVDRVVADRWNSRIATDPEHLADRLREELGSRFVANQISRIFLRRSGAQHTTSHISIARLPNTQFVTTNWDTGLEAALGEIRGSTPDIGTWMDSDFVRGWMTSAVSDNERVWHIHGIADRASETALLGHDQLLSAYSNELVRGAIQSTLASRHVIFVGVGFRDFIFADSGGTAPFRALRQGNGDPQHVAVVAIPVEGDIPARHEEWYRSADRQEWRERFSADVIFYPAAYRTDHSALAEVFEWLGELLPPSTPEEPPVALSIETGLDAPPNVRTRWQGAVHPRVLAGVLIPPGGSPNALLITFLRGIGAATGLLRCASPGHRDFTLNAAHPDMLAELDLSTPLLVAPELEPAPIAASTRLFGNDTRVIANGNVLEFSSEVGWSPSSPGLSAIAGAMNEPQTTEPVDPSSEVATFAAIVADPSQMRVARDPTGIRPLWTARLSGGWVATSELALLEAAEALDIEEVRPGEIVTLDATSRRSSLESSTRSTSPMVCSLELAGTLPIYSRLMGTSLAETRRRLGYRSMAEAPVAADFVMPATEGSREAAIGAGEMDGIPVVEPPSRLTRVLGDVDVDELGLYRVSEQLVMGRRIVLVDSELRTGARAQAICRALRRSGALEIHVRITSSPQVYRCPLGVGTTRRSALTLAHNSINDLRVSLDADSLAFLSMEGMLSAFDTQDTLGQPCTGCFDGQFPLRFRIDERDEIQSTTNVDD